MPAELRLIMFSADEVLEAVSLLNEAASQKVFTGKPVACRLRANPKAIAVLEVERGPDIATMDIDSTHLIAAIIAYCRKAHIPLPRQAKKELDVLGDVLLVKLTIGEPDESRLMSLLG